MVEVVRRYGYLPYNGPLLETKELYVTKSGDELGGEQLYHFLDKGDRAMAIRPEMTPTLARMVAARMNELPYPLRWYSIPGLLRYENPQRGRTREHWQLNVDLIGVNSIYAEAEIIEIGVQIMLNFGARAGEFYILVNNRRFMNDYLAQIVGLSAEQSTAVLKAIDRRDKVPPAAFREMLQRAGLNESQIGELERLFESSLEALSSRCGELEGYRELINLFSVLEHSGMASFVRYDPAIVRGIAYYTGTVFELQDTSPENRRSLFGGGRYENLLNLFRRDSVACVGFGLGDVTITHYLETHKLLPQLSAAAEAMAIFPERNEQVIARGLEVVQEIRKSGVRIETSLPVDKALDKLVKIADRKHVPFVVFLGPDELARGAVRVKDMRTGTQTEVPLAELASYLIAKRAQS